jgi:hypothetical protein
MRRVVQRGLPCCCRLAGWLHVMKQYVQTDLEADRQVANVLAELIIGGSLKSIDITERDRSGDEGEAA